MISISAVLVELLFQYRPRFRPQCSEPLRNSLPTKWQTTPTRPGESSVWCPLSLLFLFCVGCGVWGVAIGPHVHCSPTFLCPLSLPFFFLLLRFRDFWISSFQVPMANPLPPLLPHHTRRIVSGSWGIGEIRNRLIPFSSSIYRFFPVLMFPPFPLASFVHLLSVAVISVCGQRR